MYRAVFVILFGFILLVTFAHLDDHQLEFYDESRRSINALEMSRGESHWLVPTYAGESDWFGTKPPLLVWLQAIFIHLFGVGTLAIRLPAALATVALTALLVYWTRREWGSGLIGLLAMMIVFASEEYVVTHGARSGDYDALLVLFLTAQVVCAHRWITTGRDKYVWLLGLAVLLAGYTKGVAGGFFLPAIGLWMLASGSGRRHLLRVPIYASVGAAILLVAAYYFARDVVDPGYLSQVNTMEWGGRYFSESTFHAHGPWYYLEHLINDKYFYVFALIAPIGVLWGLITKRQLHPAFLCGLVAVLFLAILSNSVMKLYWYKSPVIPLLGLLAAYLLYSLAENLNSLSQRLWPGLLLLTYVFAYPVYYTVDLVLEPRDHMATPYYKIPYRDFMRDPAVQPPYTVLAKEYNANARFEVEIAKLAGKAVTLKHAVEQPLPKARKAYTELGVFKAGDRVVACHKETQHFMRQRYQVTVLYKRDRCEFLLVESELR